MRNNNKCNFIVFSWVMRLDVEFCILDIFFIFNSVKRYRVFVVDIMIVINLSSNF